MKTGGNEEAGKRRIARADDNTTTPTSAMIMIMTIKSRRDEKAPRNHRRRGRLSTLPPLQAADGDELTRFLCPHKLFAAAVSLAPVVKWPAADKNNLTIRRRLRLPLSARQFRPLAAPVFHIGRPTARLRRRIVVRRIARHKL
jgi:hypothetical protein